MTIRLKLTLLFALLLGIIGLVRVAGVLWGFQNTFDQLALTETQRLVGQYESYVQAVAVEMREQHAQLDLHSPAALPPGFGGDDMYLQLSDLDGRLLNKSRNLGGYSLPPPHEEGARTLTLETPGGHATTLVVARPLVLPRRGLVGWVQAALPRTQDQQTWNRLAFVELSGWLMALLVTAAVGYFFSGRALAPVAAMTAQVRQMRSTDLSRRLEGHSPPQDEIDHLAATFNDLFERLEIAFEAQHRFVADASHELKSPLTVVRGNLQLIKRRGASNPAEAAAWADTALREVDRLTRLVNELLDLARLREGSITTAQVQVDLRRLAREIAAQFQVIAPRVRCEGTETPVLITGDPDRLKQVVINLVDNALRATRAGGEVNLSVETHQAQARLTVADTGVGMPPEVLGRIFDRFYRVDAARDRSAGGTGLGLSIVSAIVRSHGGQVQVESTPGVGTRFTVSLPLAASEPERLRTAREPGGQGAPAQA